jgi:DNA-binding NarL/FixJ family response regulator
MIEQGAAAYLPKSAEPSTVATTIREVVAKGFYYTGETIEAIRQHLTNGTQKAALLPGQGLSSRELEVLQLICEQNTTAEIAERLFISPRTVDGHRNRLLEKNRFP